MSDNQEARNTLKRWVDSLPPGHIIPEDVLQAVRELTLGATVEDTGWQPDYALQGAVDHQGETVVMLQPLLNGDVQALYEDHHVLNYPPSALHPTGVHFVVVRADMTLNSPGEGAATPKVMVDVRNRIREIRDSAQHQAKLLHTQYGADNMAYVVHDLYRQTLDDLLEETEQGHTLETVESLRNAPAGTIVVGWKDVDEVPDVAVKGQGSGWWRDGLSEPLNNSGMLDEFDPTWHVMRWGDKQ